MDYLTIIIVCLAMISIGTVIILKKKNSGIVQEEQKSDRSKGSTKPVIDRKQNMDIIQIETLPITSIENENELMEITDHKVLEHVNSLIPGLFQSGNAVVNAVDALKTNGQVLYKAIIPSGAQLTQSREMEGAFRGMYHGAKGIKGHANLERVEIQKGGFIAASTAAAAMSVGSMIVGQYYMSQVNTELDVISGKLSGIIDFNDNKYRSKVFSLISHVKRIAAYQLEVIENKELRLSKIYQLDRLEEECTELLGQANLTIAGFTKKTNLDYGSYEDALRNTQKWFEYQKALLEVLYEIADLRYTLYLGNVSREQCNAMLPTYLEQVKDSQSALSNWHQKYIEHWGIDTEESRRKRDGFDKAILFIPGLINNDLNYKSIDVKTAQMIGAQSLEVENIHSIKTDELYNEDVQLISKNGKIYYLANEEESQ